MLRIALVLMLMLVTIWLVPVEAQAVKVSVKASRVSLGVLTAMAGSAPRRLAIYEGVACTPLGSQPTLTFSSNQIRMALLDKVPVESRQLTKMAMSYTKTKKARAAFAIAKIVEIGGPIALGLTAGGVFELKPAVVASIGLVSSGLKIVSDSYRPDRDEAQKSPDDIGLPWLSDFPGSITLAPGQCTQAFVFSSLYPGPERVETVIQ